MECNMDECAICLDAFSNPRLLPCGHAFCFGCLKLFKSNFFKCPKCRRLNVGPVEKLERVCELHAETLKYWCLECGIRICNKCNEHKKHTYTTCDAVISKLKKDILRLQKEVSTRRETAIRIRDSISNATAIQDHSYKIGIRAIYAGFHEMLDKHTAEQKALVSLEKKYCKSQRKLLQANQELNRYLEGLEEFNEEIEYALNSDIEEMKAITRKEVEKNPIKSPNTVLLFEVTFDQNHPRRPFIRRKRHTEIDVPIQVFIKSDNARRVLEISPIISVENLKKLIAEKLNKDAAKFEVVQSFTGKQLKEDGYVLDYTIEKDTTLLVKARH